MDRAAAAPAEPDRGAEAAQVAGHQHEVGRGQRHVGALRAHGDADRAGLQRQAVVDAVADHHRPVAGADLPPAPRRSFSSGSASAATSSMPSAAPMRAATACAVAGQQDLAVEPQAAQLGHRGGRLGARLVGEAAASRGTAPPRDDARDRAVMRRAAAAPARRGGRTGRRGRRRPARRPARRSRRSRRSRGRPRAPAGASGGTARAAARLTGWVLAAPERAGQRAGAVGRATAATGQRSSPVVSVPVLSNTTRGDVGEVFEEGRALDQDAVPGGDRDGGDGGGRRGQHQRAGAGGHQHGQRGRRHRRSRTRCRPRPSGPAAMYWPA